jgi:hypothetical protein
MKWGGLAMNTLLIFGINIVKHRKLGLRPRFWVVLTACLVAHLAAFVVLFAIVKPWSLFWFIAAFPVEIDLLDRALSSRRADA